MNQAAAKRTISVIFIVAAIVVIFAFRLSDKEPASLSESFLAMDTVMTIKAYGEGTESALSAAKDRVLKLEKELSVNLEESDIYKLNKGEGPITVSEDSLFLVASAIETAKATDGALDITLYPITKAWGFTTGENRVPGDDEIRELLKFVGYTKIELNRKEGTILIPKGTMLDLGAVAKGYAGDEIIRILKEKGITSAIASLGGSVSTLGLKPDGSKWRVAIKAPDGSGAVGVIVMGEGSVVTSGKSERFFEDEAGRKYWHIMDPKTGYPADPDFDSISIVTASALYADSLSTALFVMGLERATDHWRDQGDFEFIAVRDKTVYVTEGIAPSFEKEKGYEVVTISR